MKTNLFFKTFENHRFLMFLFAFFVIEMNAQISTFPWTETFEDSSPTRASWTQIHETNNVDWTFASAATTGSVGVVAFGGTKFANFPANTTSADRTKLVSPPFNTTLLTTPKLNFYIINPQQNGNANWVKIYYRYSATGTWNLHMQFQPPLSSWYLFTNIGMPPNIYQIAIECENAQGYSTLVDNVVVSNDDLLSVNEITKLSKSSVKYYPNPVKEMLNYSSDEKIEEINIYDGAGKKIQTHSVNANQGNVDVSGLSSGMYIVAGKTGNGEIKTYKMIKK